MDFIIHLRLDLLLFVVAGIGFSGL
jgi:hypothetical protein